ncbi:MAG: Gldg family protein [Acidobacteria bacterium]|nr:Gldg family protein [Acidobacteriota bacterium]
MMNTKINFAFVRALAKRDFFLYFSSPSGYVFITLFIFLSAAAAFWQDRFFLDNLANLDQLNRLFPFLLLLFIPALTMSVWAEEQRLGTDELLFTLPATDLEIVLGKYAATLGIYSAALVLSLSHVFVLFFLGSPDLGLMFGNYAGYWLVGAALVPVGMLASMLTANMTVAFILGAVLCGAVIFIDTVVGSFGVDAGRLVAPLSVFTPFWDFSKGVLTFSGLLTFVSVAGFFLYLNTLMASRRHWPREADGYPMWSHHTVRAVALAVALVAANAVVARVTFLRLDVTAERLSSLSDETRRLLAALPDDRTVFIQAFLSPVVPEPFVQARSNLIGILEEIDAQGGTKVEVLILDTEPFTDAAVSAREKFGIQPRAMRDLGGGQSSIVEVFLGVAFTAGAEQQVIPFFDRGLSTEYEIVRTIRVVAGSERKRVGVVDTMVKIFGGQTLVGNQQLPQWSVVNELRKQYEVVEVDAEYPIPPDIDAILVALPSSMQTDQLTNVAEYIRQGRPAMILVDPLPAVNPTLSPTEWVGDGNPFTYPPGSPRPGPRGNVRQWIRDLGVDWEPTRIVWDSYNPHPELSHMPFEVVFLGAGNENEATFNPDVDVTKDLQELVFLYPGFLLPVDDDDTDVEFEPLLRSGVVSGQSGYFTLVQQSFFGPRMVPDPRRQQDELDYILAARVRSAGPVGPVSRDEPPTESVETEADDTEADDTEADDTEVDDTEVDDTEVDETAAAEETADEETQDEESQEGEDDTPESPWATEGPLNLVVVADIDFISEQFFQIREVAPGNLNFDNVTFFLNAMDSLLEDDSFIGLRSRRARHRTLERVEARTAEFVEQRTLDEEQAEEEAEQALTDAQNRLNERVAEVQNRTDIDAQAKQIMARNLEEVENRVLSVQSANIEREKDTKNQASLERMETQIRQIQNNIKTYAILLPPVPVFAWGVWIFVRRRRREREGAAAARRLRA